MASVHCSVCLGARLQGVYVLCVCLRLCVWVCVCLCVYVCICVLTCGSQASVLNAVFVTNSKGVQSITFCIVCLHVQFLRLALPLVF